MVQHSTEVEAPTNETLRGRQVAITGRLASMTQDEAFELIVRCGGETTRLPGRRTSLLVVGQEGDRFRIGHPLGVGCDVGDVVPHVLRRGCNELFDVDAGHGQRGSS